MSSAPPRCRSLAPIPAANSVPNLFTTPPLHNFTSRVKPCPCTPPLLYPSVTFIPTQPLFFAADSPVLLPTTDLTLPFLATPSPAPSLAPSSTNSKTVGEYQEHQGDIEAGVIYLLGEQDVLLQQLDLSLWVLVTVVPRLLITPLLQTINRALTAKREELRVD